MREGAGGALDAAADPAQHPQAEQPRPGRPSEEEGGRVPEQGGRDDHAGGRHERGVAQRHRHASDESGGLAGEHHAEDDRALEEDEGGHDGVDQPHRLAQREGHELVHVLRFGADPVSGLSTTPEPAVNRPPAAAGQPRKSSSARAHGRADAPVVGPLTSTTTGARAGRRAAGTASGATRRPTFSQSPELKAASKAASGRSKARRRTNSSASGAPSRRSIPASSHSTEIGPS